MKDTHLFVALTCVAVACLLSAAATRVVRAWAIRRGVVDLPGGHKTHHRPVALLGGIAIVTAVLLPMLAAIVAARVLQTIGADWLPASLSVHLPGISAKTWVGLAVIGGGCVLHVLGLLDDVRPLGAMPKLLVQVVVAVFVVTGFDVRLLTVAGPTASTILSVLWIVTLTNAFNFLDNMDGLASGVALIATSVFAATAMQAGQLFVPACCWLLVGALLGFLPYNYHPASIFLGDAGSLVVGYLVAVLTILTNFADPTYGQRPAGVLAPLVVMAVPLYDTASVFFLRWRAGHSVWRADRRHFSHRLQNRGLSVRESVGVIWLATAITSFPAVLLPTATWPLAIGIVCQTAAVVVLVAYLEKGGPSRV
ncbi:MAG: undecaprenyl/decaprenyl-phosphate alpha-N-acetylglucosaminyl 1-phosphate transferase [Phycisphaerae bacterium]|nr:undecaprenyl/decaprenyl-phosphate alpha-N-acetylglucosaminyl 1-phosphate transferase [Phycisphaerae bacterium]NUQ46030.1 undecaprenyl/decaprenyl-phosphate alpha-N-acetylglucosaminyl 1-phosphate transferase [Phycisphaerae bacterium]